MDDVETLRRLTTRADEATELGDAVDARRDLQRFLSDERLSVWLISPDPAGCEALALSTSPSLWTGLVEAMRVFASGQAAATVLASPSTASFIDAVAAKAASDDLELAVLAAQVLRIVIKLQSAHASEGSAVTGACISSRLANNGIFRLLDEANPGSEDNRTVSKFLATFAPTAVEFIFEDFCQSVSNGDVLQFANDAAAVALLSKHIQLPSRCRDSFLSALRLPLNTMEFSFAASGVAIAITGDPDAWDVSKDLALAVMHRLVNEELFVQSSACDSVLLLLHACATTDGGLQALLATNGVADAISRALAYPQAHTKLGALKVLSAVAERFASKKSSASGLLADHDFFVRQVWPLRLSPDELVRAAMWALVLPLCRVRCSQLAPTVAAVLVASDERASHVRELQLQCAAFLLSVPEIAPLHDGLRKTMSAGVFNAGVAVGSAAQH